MTLSSNKTSLYRETNISTQQQVFCLQYMTAGTHAPNFKQDKLTHAGVQKRRNPTDRYRSFPDKHSQFSQPYVKFTLTAQTCISIL